MLISAAAPGRVQKIAYSKGAFFPVNSQIATINNIDGLYASATYTLTSPDYTRLNTKSRIEVKFPDGQVLNASVYNISFERGDKEVLTTVRPRFYNTDLKTETFSVGTPINTVLELGSDTFLERIVNGAKSIITPHYVY